MENIILKSENVRPVFFHTLPVDAVFLHKQSFYRKIAEERAVGLHADVESVFESHYGCIITLPQFMDYGLTEDAIQKDPKTKDGEESNDWNTLIPNPPLSNPAKDNYGTIIRLAGVMYTSYYKGAGGVAYNGDTPPTWAEFCDDESKRKQRDAWLGAAEAAGVSIGYPSAGDVSKILLKIYAGRGIDNEAILEALALTLKADPDNELWSLIRQLQEKPKTIKIS